MSPEDYKELAKEVNQLRSDLTLAVASLNMLLEQNDRTIGEVRAAVTAVSTSVHENEKKLTLLMHRIDTQERNSEKDTTKVRALELSAAGEVAGVQRDSAKYRTLATVVVAVIAAFAGFITTLINLLKDTR